MAQICQRCHGNGYIKVKESIENPTETIQQCPLCKSQGEIMDKNTFEQTRQQHKMCGITSCYPTRRITTKC